MPSSRFYDIHPLAAVGSTNSTVDLQMQPRQPCLPDSPRTRLILTARDASGELLLTRAQWDALPGKKRYKYKGHISDDRNADRAGRKVATWALAYWSSKHAHATPSSSGGGPAASAAGSPSEEHGPARQHEHAHATPSSSGGGPAASAAGSPSEEHGAGRHHAPAQAPSALLRETPSSEVETLANMPAVASVPLRSRTLPAREGWRDTQFPPVPKPSATMHDHQLLGKLGARETDYVVLAPSAARIIWQHALSIAENKYAEAKSEREQKAKKLRTLKNGLATIDGAERLDPEGAFIAMSWCPSNERIVDIQRCLQRSIDADVDLNQHAQMEAATSKLGGALVPPGMRVAATASVPIILFSIADGKADDDDHTQDRLELIARAATVLSSSLLEMDQKSRIIGSLAAELGGDAFELRRALCIKPRRVGDFLQQLDSGDPMDMAEIVMRRNQHQPSQTVWAKPTSQHNNGKFQVMMEAAGVKSARAKVYAHELYRMSSLMNRSGIGDRQHGQKVELSTDGNGQYSPRSGLYDDTKAEHPIVESHMEDEAAFNDYQRIAFEHANPLTMAEQQEAERQRERYGLISNIGPLYHGEAGNALFKYMHRDKAGQGELLLQLAGIVKKALGSEGIDYGDKVLGLPGAVTAIAFFSIGFLVPAYEGVTIICFDGEEAEHGAVTVLPPVPVYGGFDDKGFVNKPEVLQAFNNGEPVSFEETPPIAARAELEARGALGLSIGYWNDAAGQKQWAEAGTATSLSRARASREGQAVQHIAQRLAKTHRPLYSIEAAMWLYFEKSWRARVTAELRAGWFALCEHCRKDAGDALGPMAICDACNRGWHFTACLPACMSPNRVTAASEDELWYCVDCSGIEAEASAVAAPTAELKATVAHKGCSGSGRCSQGGSDSDSCCSGLLWGQPRPGARIWCKRGCMWITAQAEEATWWTSKPDAISVRPDSLSQGPHRLLVHGEVWGYCECVKRTRTR